MGLRRLWRGIDIGESGHPVAGCWYRWFAALNCNWRLDTNPRPAGTGSFPINADGVWCAVDASSGSITPADFGAYIVEAGIDDLTLFDAGGPTGFPLPPPPTRLAFAAPRPNPARGAVELTLETGGGALTVEILDLAGRRVRTLFQGPAPPGTLRLPWRGTDDHGRRLGAGLYFARARTGGEESVTRFAFVP